MNISPISLVNTVKLNEKNISFGRFDSEKTKHLAEKTVMATSNNDEYSIQDNKQIIEWYSQTPYLTVKHAVTKDGDYVIYAEMEKTETKKSRHSELFDRVAADYKRQWNMSQNKDAKKLGLVKSTPTTEFLTTLDYKGVPIIMYMDFRYAESGHHPKLI